MSNPIIRIHDLTTNEVIDREMTDTEFEAYQAEQSIELAETQAQSEILATKEAAQAKLLALGLTQEDLIAMGLLPKPIEFNSGTLD